MKIKNFLHKGVVASKSKISSKSHLILHSSTRSVNKTIIKTVDVEITYSLVGVQTHKFKQMTLMRFITKEILLCLLFETHLLSKASRLSPT